MRICIYQIDPRKDTDRLRGYSLKVLKDIGKEIDPAIYYKTMDAECDCYNLEDFCVKYMETPAVAHIGREFGISDIIQMKKKYYYCDRDGLVPVLFQPRKDSFRQETRCVILEPNRNAYSAFLPALEETIEQILGIRYTGRMEEALFLNREAVCLHASGTGRKYNRRIRTTDVVGPALICGINEGDLSSLTIEQEEKYLKQYREADYLEHVSYHRTS